MSIKISDRTLVAYLLLD